jgi:hypothetical protein
MAVDSWEDDIRKRKVLTVFPTQKLTGSWLTTFKDAITQFNKLSKLHNLGVTLSSPSNATKPDPVGEGGAEVQFDLGKGTLAYQALGQSFEAKDEKGNLINFSPFDIHGYTEKVLRSFGDRPDRVRRAFIFVPETPMVEAPKKVGPGRGDFSPVKRVAGSGIRLVIAVHEFIHACGLSDDEHTERGPDADVFATYATVAPGLFERPEEDKILLHLARRPHPNVFAPPIFIKKKVADLIRNNWK